MSLKNLQTKIGVGSDGAFGPGTLKAAMAYYKMEYFDSAAVEGLAGYSICI